MGRDMSGRKLRAGIVGGGQGSFIGAVHRVAAELDGQVELVAGAMSSDAERAQASAQAWYLKRSYPDFVQMARTESGLSSGIDLVIIATPNHLHFSVARAFLEQGIHVVCDKPITFSVAQAQELVALVERSGCVFALTHNYTGYPAVRQARALVRQGELGEIRKVLVEYLQDWLIEPLERSGNRQAMWRTDPARAGLAGCLGDIGTHAENLLECISGQRISALCADLSTFVQGRQLDDDAHILLRLANGGKGILTCSQIAAGEENALTIRVYGSKAGLQWQQQEPNTLLFKPVGRAPQILRTGQSSMSEEAQSVTRLPAGHPEGFYEAFATIYRLACADIRRVASGHPAQGGYPSVYDGLRGMQFVAGAVESSRQGAVWVTLPGPYAGG
jgi:predicted dehydrogenase